MHLFDSFAFTGFVASLIFLLGLWMFLEVFCWLMPAISFGGVSIY